MDAARWLSPRLRDLPKWRRIGALVLTLSLAFVLGSAGASKVAGQERTVDQFEEWDLPDSLRPLVGSIEVALAILLLLPWTRFWGAALMAPWALGAIATHLRVEQYANALAPFILGCLAMLAAYLLMPGTMGRQRPAAVPPPAQRA